MTQRRLNRGWLVAATALFLLLLAGCGGSGSGSGSVVDNTEPEPMAPMTSPVDEARADLVAAQEALEAAGDDVAAQVEAHEAIVAARAAIHRIVNTPDTQALLADAREHLGEAQEALEEYNSDAGQLTRAEEQLKTVRMNYAEAQKAVFDAEAALNLISNKQLSNPLYFAAKQKLLDAQNTQLRVFNQLIDLQEDIEDLTPETVKLKRARDQLQAQVDALRQQLATEQARSRALDAQLNPDPVVASPFKGGSVMLEIAKTANRRQASSKIAAAAGTAPVLNTVTLNDQNADHEDYRLLTGVHQVSGSTNNAGTAIANGNVTGRLGLFVEKDKSGVDYTLKVGSGKGEDVALLNGRVQDTIGGPENSAASPTDLDGDLIVNAATTYEEGKEDYMSYGVWVYIPDETDRESLNGDPYQFGVFAHGNAPSLAESGDFAIFQALTGTATYNGTATGLYTNTATNQTGLYDADATLAADFGSISGNAGQGGNITGTLTNSRIDGVAISGGTIILQGLSTWGTGATGNGAGNMDALDNTTPMFTGSAIMVKGTNQLNGNWGGVMYGDVGSSAARPKMPTGVAGTFGVSGGTEAIIGAFGAEKQ